MPRPRRWPRDRQPVRVPRDVEQTKDEATERASRGPAPLAAVQGWALIAMSST
jgi:hypothetical protein